MAVLLRTLRRAYETRIAVAIARTFWPLLLPAYLVARLLGIRFVANISDSMGHSFPEYDNFFRRLYLGELPPNRRYVLIKRSNPFARATVRAFRHRFFWACSNELIYYLTLPLIMRFDDIVADAGLSRLKWQLDKQGAYFPAFGQPCVANVGKSVAAAQWASWYRRRAQSPGFWPIKEFRLPQEAVLELLGGSAERVALVHVKNLVVNATARATDPDTYLPALALLRENGYRLVFVGRESMPDAFRAIGVLNYAESSYATVENDIVLFAMADCAITAGSGICLLADCLNKPYVYANYWHIGFPMPSRLCVAVPTVVKTRDGEWLTFSQQSRLYHESYEPTAEVFPAHSHVAVNATAEEILAATEEMLALMESFRPRSPEQDMLARMPSAGLWEHAACRIGAYFLESHRELWQDLAQAEASAASRS